jgi:lactate 2-monooxygenase
VSWEDLRWIRSQTNLPIAVKGIQHPDDARMAIAYGADVLYCTNHGGRQATSGIPTLELLPRIVAVACSTPVMFDSGVRDATDVVIALALGATAVGIGRPYAYAVSYGGTESLTHFLKSFLAELDLPVHGDLWLQGHRQPQGSGLRSGHGFAELNPNLLVMDRHRKLTCGSGGAPSASR